MKSPSTEHFHAKIDRTIRLVQSYTEIDYLGWLIKSARLKPHAHIFEGFRHGVKLQNWWVDEYRNSLEITKKKKLQITYNDLRLDKNKIICTDIYYGLSMKQIAQISKLVYLCAGKDEDLYQNCFLITFVGIDNFLRTYLSWFGEWQPVSPLLLGEEHFQILFHNLDVKHFQQIKKYKENPIPCQKEQVWLSYLPASDDFLNVIKNQYETLLPIFKEINNG
ncbi:MAG: hypothetical protein HQL12_09685 [Candidatus Omnitrophica bacterium]|nr:hypothetical protein [Candidatus Omnitrophota bacterium]